MQLGQAQSILYFFPDQTGNEPFILENGTKNPNSVQIVDFLPIDETNADFIAQGSYIIKSLNQNKYIQYLDSGTDYKTIIENNGIIIDFHDYATAKQIQLNIDTNAYFQLYHNKGAGNYEIQYGAFDGVNYNDIILTGTTQLNTKSITFQDPTNEFLILDNGSFSTVLKSSTLTANKILYVPNLNGTLQVEQYTEAFGAQVVNTIINTWQAIVLTGAPINSIVDVLVTNASAGVAYDAGVRAVGSSLARIVSTTGSNSCCVTVKTNSSGQAEFYSGNLANISFRYLGVHGK